MLYHLSGHHLVGVHGEVKQGLNANTTTVFVLKADPLDLIVARVLPLGTNLDVVAFFELLSFHESQLALNIDFAQAVIHPEVNLCFGLG